MFNNLATMRIRAGLTQKELADMTGISESAICRAEKGATDFSGTRWVLIAMALGCTVDELLKVDNGV